MRKIKAVLLEANEDTKPADIDTADVVLRLFEQSIDAIEFVKHRYGLLGVYALMLGTELKEFDERIEQLETELADLYQLRKGKMVDNDWGWCVGCGKVKVCATDGDDTCGDCLAGQ